MKLTAIILMFLAEGLCIFGENMIASRVKTGVPFSDYWLLMLGVTLSWGLALTVAYGVGMKAFDRIWTVSVVSFAAIVVMEPLIVWNYWHEVPSKGEAFGIILGFSGMLCALF